MSVVMSCDVSCDELGGQLVSVAMSWEVICVVRCGSWEGNRRVHLLRGRFESVAIRRNIICAIYLTFYAN